MEKCLVAVGIRGGGVVLAAVGEGLLWQVEEYDSVDEALGDWHFESKKPGLYVWEGKLNKMWTFDGGDDSEWVGKARPATLVDLKEFGVMLNG